MKTTSCIVIFVLIAPRMQAQTNLTELLQQGMFEEQANHNLDAAISNYQALSTQFDKDRQLAATAIFRLGECYREEGQTNQAAIEYRRILSEFHDQKTLVMLSQEDLAGMGAALPVAGEMTENSAAPAMTGNTSAEAAQLARQISSIESLSNTVEEARAVLAIFPENSADLQKALMHLPLLQDQEAWAEAHPQTSYYDFQRTRQFVFANGADDLRTVEELLRQLQMHQNTNLLASAQLELEKELAYIQHQVDFGLGLQKARLKALQAAAGMQNMSETARDTAPSDDEDQEIAHIQQMIQNSPDLINAPDEHGHTPLEKAAMDGSLKVAAFLLDHGADVNAGKFSALNMAANAGNRAMVKFLLDHGAGINAKAWKGETPLHTAASEGYTLVTEALVANKADLDARDDFGATPILDAARNGHGQTVQMLAWAGANPNIADKDGRTALSFAAGSGSAETVKALLAAKADPNGGTLDAPLLCAIDKQDLASAELLLQAGADPNVDGLMHCPQNSYGSRWYGEYSAAMRKAPALWLAIQNHQLPMVQLLLKYKANPDNSQISEPPAAIFWALSNTDILQALLNAGANPNLVRSDGRTPLSVAADSGLLEAVKLLLAAKADPNGDVSNPPLACAVSQNYSEIVHVLLQAGANPNLGYPAQRPVHLAADRLNEGILQLLLNAGADPNVQNDWGYTPLKIVESGNWNDQQKTIAASMVDLLQQHGAMEVLPDWDRITVSRPSTKYSNAMFSTGHRDWNQFTLYDLLGVQYDLLSPAVRQNWDWKYDSYPVHNALPFPDFSRIVIHRPPVRGTNWTDLKIDLARPLDSGDCSADVPLKFGDVVEIPEVDHVLEEQWPGLSTNQLLTLAHCLTRHLEITVNGVATNITVGPQVTLQPAWPRQYAVNFVPAAPTPPKVIKLTLQGFMLWPVLDDSQLLLSSSDLSHVMVKRRDPTTGQIREWTVDCSDSKNSAPNFWLRDGDVIEVPEER